jgi:TctA family transporter
MDLHDALAKEIFDQVKDRAGVTLQEAADRGKFPAVNAWYTLQCSDGADGRRHDDPGPQVMTKNPQLFWGLIVSMWVGNLMLVILNLPLVGLWVKLLSIPYRYLFPAIMVFCSIGVFSINNGTFEVYEAALFCVFGYMLMKLDLPAAPLLLGLVLGPAIEENFRRAMVLSRGDSTVFLTSPLSSGLLAAAAVAIVLITLPAIRSKREEALKE